MTIFRLRVVEKEPPYLVSVISFDEDALVWGRIANRKACALFARSFAANDWPGFREPGQNRDRAFRVGLPPWAIYQLQDRDEAGEFRHVALADLTCGAAPSASQRSIPDRRRRRWASSTSLRPSAPARIS